MRVLGGLLLLAVPTVAFLPSQPMSNRLASCTRLSMVAAGDVLPEKMEGFTVSKVSDGEDGLSRYAVKGFVTPAEYKKVYQETQAEQKKQANFRGFRAGKIPPALMAAVREFAVVAAVEAACLAAVEEYELEPVVPASGIPEIQIKVPDDVAAYAKSYDAKAEITFEAELDLKGEPQIGGEEAAEGDVIDVTPKEEAEPVSG